MSSNPSVPTTDNPLIDVKHSLKQHFDTYGTISKLVAFIKSIPQFQKLKNDIQLTNTVCDIIEELIPNNNKKVDKLQLLISVFTEAFKDYGFSPDDIDTLKKHVQYLWNNKLIKAIPLSKKLLKTATQWIFRRIDL
jgi:hypothetical protein